MAAELGRLVVEGFRSIRRVELDLTTDVTVLIGANGSGKSNLVSALELIWGCLLSSGQGGAGPLFLAWDRGARLVVRRCLPGCGARVSWTRGGSDMRGSGCRMTILRRGGSAGLESGVAPGGAAHSWCACAPCALRPVWPRRAGERVWWVRSWFLRTWLSRSGRGGSSGRAGRAGPRRPWLPGTTASRRSRGRWRWRPRRASCRGRSGPGSGRAGGGCRHRPVPRPVRGPGPSAPVWPWRAGRRGRGARRPRSAGAGRGCSRVFVMGPREAGRLPRRGARRGPGRGRQAMVEPLKRPWSPISTASDTAVRALTPRRQARRLAVGAGPAVVGGDRRWPHQAGRGVRWCAPPCPQDGRRQGRQRTGPHADHVVAADTPPPGRPRGPGSAPLAPS